MKNYETKIKNAENKVKTPKGKERLIELINTVDQKVREKNKTREFVDKLFGRNTTSREDVVADMAKEHKTKNLDRIKKEKEILGERYLLAKEGIKNEANFLAKTHPAAHKGTYEYQDENPYGSHGKTTDTYKAVKNIEISDGIEISCDTRVDAKHEHIYLNGVRIIVDHLDLESIEVLHYILKKYNKSAHEQAEHMGDLRLHMLRSLEKQEDVKIKQAAQKEKSDIETTNKILKSIIIK